MAFWNRRSPQEPAAKAFAEATAMVALADYAGSLEPAQMAVELQPERVDYRLLLGDVLVGLERPTEAIDHLQIAAKLAPDAAEPAFRIAETYARIGRHDWALAHYRQALLRDPGHQGAANGVNAASLVGMAFAMDQREMRQQHQAWAMGQFKVAKRRMRRGWLWALLLGRWRR